MINADYIKALAAKAGKLPPVGDLAKCEAVLREVRETGDAGADRSMARLIASHGNYTAEAKAYAARYASE